jgi:hypothetical protein
VVHTHVRKLDRDKQLGVVRELTDIVAAQTRDAALAERARVLISESPEGRWGITGHASTGADPPRPPVLNGLGTDRPGPLRHRIARAGCPQTALVRTGLADLDRDGL